MEVIKQKRLDLRKWWIQIKKQDVEQIVNNKDKWKYWWFRDNKHEITTLENGKLSHYKVDEIEVLFNQTPEKVSEVEQETKSEVLTDLFLSPENRVKDTAAAYQKAKYSDKTTFWFVSAWRNKAIIMLDFSKWDKPKRTVYPLSKYNIKMKPVKV